MFPFGRVGPTFLKVVPWIPLNKKTCNWWSYNMQPLILDNSSSRKCHLIQRPGNKFLAWAWSSESSLKAWGAGSSRRYRRNRNRISNISRGRIARTSLRHIIFLLRYRSLCIEAYMNRSRSRSSERRAQACLHFLATWLGLRQRRHNPLRAQWPELRQL